MLSGTKSHLLTVWKCGKNEKYYSISLYIHYYSLIRMGCKKRIHNTNYTGWKFSEFSKTFICIARVLSGFKVQLAPPHLNFSDEWLLLLLTPKISVQSHILHHLCNIFFSASPNSLNEPDCCLPGRTSINLTNICGYQNKTNYPLHCMCVVP